MYRVSLDVRCVKWKDMRMSQFAESPQEGGAPSARRTATRERLLDAAIEVFSEVGLQAAAVETICSVAGFTRGAFYSNFESKEQLFLALLQRELERRAATLREKAAEIAPQLSERSGGSSQLTMEEVAAYAAAFLSLDHESKHQATHWYVLETEFLLLAMRDPAIARDYAAYVNGFYDGIADVVDQIVHAAGRTFTLPIDRAVAVLKETHESVLREAVLQGTHVHPSPDLLGERLAVVLFAITAPHAA